MQETERDVQSQLTAFARAYAPFFLSLLALALWYLSIRRIDLTAAGDLGLVSILRPWTYLAYGLLVASLVWGLLSNPVREPVLILQALVLIVMLFGFLPIIEDLPGYRVAYRHVGIVDYVARHGGLDPRVDAYFNWPGFFTFFAFISTAARVAGLFWLLSWASVIFNILYMPALVMIYRSITDNRRLVWLAVFIFYLVNWPSQDYFAPQALAYFFYLTAFGILINWLTPEEDALTADSPAEALGPLAGMTDSQIRMRRVWLVATVMLLFAAMTSAHQLTPFALMFLMAAFLIARYTKHWRPLVFMAVLLVGWVIYVAAPYIAGRLADLLATIGAVETIADEGVVTRFSGGPLRMIVVGSRLVLSVGVWGAAFSGFLIARKRIPKLFKFLLAIAAPMTLVALQPYGGEMPIRVYLYTMPFSALLIAAGLIRIGMAKSEAPEERRHSLRFTAATLALSAVLLSGFLVARYGNAAVEYFIADDVAAVTFLYENVPHGALILAVSENLPWKAEHYTDYQHRTVVRVKREGRGAPLVPLVLEYMQEKGKEGAYFAVTDSAIRYLETGGLMTEADVRGLEADLIAAGALTLVYENPTSRVYRYTPGDGT